VLDKISIEVEKTDEAVTAALAEHKEYISAETQARTLEFNGVVSEATEVDMDEFILKVKIQIAK
jgi:isoleucyl-tRNA synthetase